MRSTSTCITCLQVRAANLATKRKPRHVGPVETWPPYTTSREVIEWACRSSTELLVLFYIACDKQNDAHMLEGIRLLRGMVTRLDQFRRMKARQRAAQAKPTEATETTPQ